MRFCIGPPRKVILPLQPK